MKGVTSLQIVHPDEHVFLPSGTEAGRGTNAVARFLEKHAGGGTTTTTVVSVGQGAVRATGTLTLSTASGVVGGSINGVASTVTASGGDTATAAALAAAINANVSPLVAGIVTASSVGPVVTVTAVEYGKTGNAVTLSAAGTGVTASGARLTGGVTEGLVALRR